MHPIAPPNARAEPGAFRETCRTKRATRACLLSGPRRAVKAKWDYGAALVLVTYSRNAVSGNNEAKAMKNERKQTFRNPPIKPEACMDAPLA